jgi:hypothetical protein
MELGRSFIEAGLNQSKSKNARFLRRDLEQQRDSAPLEDGQAARVEQERDGKASAVWIPKHMVNFTRSASEPTGLSNR